MKSTYLGLFAATAVSSVFAAMMMAAAAETGAATDNASPIYGVTVPQGYRQWELIAPSQETEPLNELRAIVGNPVAITAYRDNTLPFPDGTVLVKLAWKHVQSSEFASAFVPGATTTVQVMVKDSQKYPATGSLPPSAIFAGCWSIFSPLYTARP